MEMRTIRVRASNLLDATGLLSWPEWTGVPTSRNAFRMAADRPGRRPRNSVELLGVERERRDAALRTGVDFRARPINGRIRF